jgi:glycosyltransferase involved in cell wall biosynthesis
MTTRPKVSFVVPCYKLAHLLPECIDSILSQSFENFEILIMDDCSPDDTPKVAKSFRDPRVKHVRNEPNLGHLRNYNKGIDLACGKYVWLISADDRLRKTYVLERYVELMDRHEEVGFACCPGVLLENGRETRTAEYSLLEERNCIIKGHRFFKRLVFSNVVIAASGMVRKSCYERYGAFPLNMPYAGDWYLWCLFALYEDVAYFAEPMVNYRVHPMSMTTTMMEDRARICARENLAVLWGIAEKVRQLGKSDMLRMIREAIAQEYAQLIACRKYGITEQLSVDDFEDLLRKNTRSDSEAVWMRGRVYAAAADQYFSKLDLTRACEFYSRALKHRPWSLKTHIKSRLLYTGRVGLKVRTLFSRHVSGSRSKKRQLSEARGR